MPQSILMTVRVIWGGLLLSPVLLAFIAWVLLAGHSERSEEVSMADPLLLAFLLMATIDFVLASKIQVLLSSNSGPESDECSNRQIQARYIVQLALFEVPAILGFSLAVMKGSLLVFAPFLLLSLVGFALSCPGKGKLRGEIL